MHIMHYHQDVGAEAGRFSLLATDTNATVIGIDIDSYGLKRLKLKTKRVNVIQADARKIPLKDETFDAIFMIEVLDYILNRRGFKGMSLNLEIKCSA